MTPYPIVTILPSFMPTPTTEDFGVLTNILAGIFSLVFVGIAFWVVALIDILKSEFKEPINKIIWLVLTLFLPFLGPVLYFLIGRKQAKTKSGINLKVAFTIVSLIAWYPLGVVLMWFWTKWPMWVKVLLTSILGVAIYLTYFYK